MHGGSQDLATVYADSSTQCCTICRQRSGCVAWTYRITGSQPKCYLVAGKGESERFIWVCNLNDTKLAVGAPRSFMGVQPLQG